MDVRKVLLGITLSLLLTSGVAFSADYNKGLKAAQLGDFETALAEWAPLAESGNSVAQANLGMMYEFGKGVLQNNKTAVKWHTLASEQGDASAQNNLGIMYEKGRGVLKDTKRGYMWYSIASYTGNNFGTKNKDKITKKMTLSQIDKAQEMSRKCLSSGYTDC